MKNYLKTVAITCLLFLTINVFKSYSQTCPCSGILCATDAASLASAIQYANGNANQQNPLTINICGTIYLGDAPFLASDFPIELEPYISLRGDWNFVSGTRIVFPYLYKSGLTCATQQRVVNGG